MSLNEVRPVNGKGRGIFARRAFRAEDLIETAPVIVIPREQCDHVAQTILDHYWFNWDEAQESGAIVLGFGMLYNHSFTPNARFVKKIEDREVHYFANRSIAEGEEICINYCQNYDNHEVWFDVIP